MWDFCQLVTIMLYKLVEIGYTDSEKTSVHCILVQKVRIVCFTS